VVKSPQFIAATLVCINLCINDDLLLRGRFVFTFVFVLSVRNFISLVSIKPLDFKSRVV